VSRNLLHQSPLVIRSFVRVARERGVVRTAHLALSELLFDTLNGTDTSLEFEERASPHRPSHPSHAGCNPVIFRELVARVPVQRETSGFLDLGAGKGRALLLAERCGFRRVIGVERSHAQCAVAERNISAYRRRDATALIEVYRGDAATFEIPDDVNVIFLYNPFGPETILRVIQRIAESIARSSRSLYVVYQHPRFAEQFVAAGFTSLHRQGSDGVVLLAERTTPPRHDIPTRE
jgi:SAM-dependent methyltransferase